jgi:hypothetical protein
MGLSEASNPRLFATFGIFRNPGFASVRVVASLLDFQ